MKDVGHTEIIEPQIFNDERTGREIWRISPADRRSFSNYVYKSSFTPDERFLIYIGEIDGARKLFRYEISSGATTLMTGADTVVGDANIHPNGREVFCRIEGGATISIDINTLEKRLVFDPADHALEKVSQQIMFSRSGRWFSFAYTYAEDKVAIARAECNGGGYETVYRHNSRAQHLMFCPASDELMSFSMAPDFQQTWDLPDIERSRTFLLDVKSSSIRPLVCLPKPFTATHDYWSPNGDRIYFHKKTRPTWVPTWINSIDRVTGEETEHFRSDTIMLGHSSVDKDETFIVSDCQNPEGNEMIKIDLKSGEHEVLCWPDTDVPGGHAEGGHAHPSISPSSKYVLYGSNVSGTPQVYLLPLR